MEGNARLDKLELEANNAVIDEQEASEFMNKA